MYVSYKINSKLWAPPQTKPEVPLYICTYIPQSLCFCGTKFLTTNRMHAAPPRARAEPRYRYSPDSCYHIIITPEPASGPL